MLAASCPYYTQLKSCHGCLLQFAHVRALIGHRKSAALLQTLVTTSQEHRTKETLFATPERRAPGNCGTDDQRSGRKRRSPGDAAAEAAPSPGAPVLLELLEILAIHRDQARAWARKGLTSRRAWSGGNM